jgi:hypothetical protein
MKKLIVGAVVAAIIVFVWQFLSWSMLNIHGASFQYSENQDEILECLNGKLDDGSYFLPTVAPGTSSADREAYMANMVDKPWAIINYHSSFGNSMGMNMARGFFANLVATLLLCWVLLKIPNLGFKDTIFASVAIGLIGYLTISYINSAWFETSSIGYLIDTLVGWGLVGAWLGWWLNRE